MNGNVEPVMQDFGGDDEIVFSVFGHAATIRLTRPKALNALTHKMVLAMERALLDWADAGSVHAVIIEGEGRAFCAGGDVVAAWHAGKAGTPPFDFFRDEYRLNGLLGRYPKPLVAMLDGITMGGGAGISMHGSHRIVTENTLFAMPESGIGFFTDVGASAFLPRLPEHLGLYLGLTGNPIRWGDCLHSGLATHALPAARLDDLRAALSAGEAVEAAIAAAQTDFTPPTWELSALARKHIAACCGKATMQECIEAFAEDGRNGHPKAAEIAQLLQRRSPTSLMVIWNLLRESEQFIRANPQLSYSACLDRQLQIEYALAQILLQDHDFYAGVGAVLIEKTGNPQWQPASLDAVRMEKFMPLQQAE